MRLRGRLRVAGAKNSSLAIIAAAALAPDRSVLENVPLCRDVLCILDILRALGVRAEFTAPFVGKYKLRSLSSTAPMTGVYGNPEYSWKRAPSCQ